MEDVRNTTAPLDEQALGAIYDSDTPADCEGQPEADPEAPMQSEAALPAPQGVSKPTPRQAPETHTRAEPATEPLSEPLSEAEIAARIAEAEQRGYLRGRNEAVSLAMQQPAMWQVAGSEVDCEEPSDSDTAFLRHIRPSIWD